jgi:shikimate kinase
MNICLLGFRCAGKSSVGQALARRLGRAFYDTAGLISEETGRTVTEIVAAGGWPAFRAEEKKVVARLALQDGCVIALGGGAVLDRDNTEALRANGYMVWLTADLETILARMTQDHATAAQRPPLQGSSPAEETAILLEERTPVYEAAADVIVDTRGQNVDAIVEVIVRATREE